MSVRGATSDGHPDRDIRRLTESVTHGSGVRLTRIPSSRYGPPGIKVHPLVAIPNFR